MPRGGPDGGDGGSGGDVWLVADHNVASLLAFRDHPHRRATDGAHGMGKGKHGAAGKDIDRRGARRARRCARWTTGALLADLVNHGDRWRAAAGGRGGRGNARFLSNTRRAPSFAEQGEHGEERWLLLELKLMADVALVGFPNVGQEHADQPHLRRQAQDRRLSVHDPRTEPRRRAPRRRVRVRRRRHPRADRRRERGSRARAPLPAPRRARAGARRADRPRARPKAARPTEQERVLLDELGRYQPDLLERPRIVVGSRRTWPIADVAVGWAAHECDHRRGRRASSSGRWRRSCTRRATAEPVAEGLVIHRPALEGVRVEREGDGVFRVIGRAAERAVALSDLTNPEALAYVDHRLEALGRRQGARAGRCACGRHGPRRRLQLRLRARPDEHRRREDRHVVDHRPSRCRSTSPRSRSSVTRSRSCASTATTSSSSPRAPCRPGSPRSA